MNDLQVFRNAEFGELTLLEIDNEPWFVGKEVAEKLGYTNQNEAIQDHVYGEDKLNSKTLSSFDGHNFGQRGAWLINESGLYSLILGSKLESAKRFKRWVTSEVLPSIRKHGMYAMDELLDNPDIAIEALTRLKEEREKRKSLECDVERMKPKEIFADSVASSHTSILIGELAKILKANGHETGQKRLFETLRQDGFLIKRKGSDFNMPTQKSMELGLMEIKETTINNADGSIRLNKTTKVTGKGQIYFVNRYCGCIERL